MAAATRSLSLICLLTENTHSDKHELTNQNSVTLASLKELTNSYNKLTELENNTETKPTC